MTTHIISDKKQYYLDIGMNDHTTKPIGTAFSYSKPEERQKKTATTEPAVATGDPEYVSTLLKGLDVKSAVNLMADNVDLYLKFLQQFRDFYKNIVKGVQDNIENSDFETIQRMAHTIKGQAGNVGADTLRSAALELEKAAKSKDIDVVKIAFNEFTKEINSVMHILKDI